MPTAEQLDDALPPGKLGTDPIRWAGEFRRAATRLGYSEMDEAWLVGWFGKALETGFEVAKVQTRSEDRDQRAIWNEALATAMRTMKALRR